MATDLRQPSLDFQALPQLTRAVMEAAMSAGANSVNSPKLAAAVS